MDSQFVLPSDLEINEVTVPAKYRIELIEGYDLSRIRFHSLESRLSLRDGNGHSLSSPSPGVLLPHLRILHSQPVLCSHCTSFDLLRPRPPSFPSRSAFSSSSPTTLSISRRVGAALRSVVDPSSTTTASPCKFSIGSTLPSLYLVSSLHSTSNTSTLRTVFSCEQWLLSSRPRSCFVASLL